LKSKAEIRRSTAFISLYILYIFYLSLFLSKPETSNLGWRIFNINIMYAELSVTVTVSYWSLCFLFTVFTAIYCTCMAVTYILETTYGANTRCEFLYVFIYYLLYGLYTR